MTWNAAAVVVLSVLRVRRVVDMADGIDGVILGSCVCVYVCVCLLEWCDVDDMSGHDAHVL